MLTPQEVSSHAFTKAVMGGYNMAMVDEFLDELTDDYTALYKENAALKAKMKVLVEKVEDYRATEDSMRATLLTAQRMADSIVREAEAKRDQVVARAESDNREKIAAMQQRLAESEGRLRAGQEALARFIVTSRELCAKELRFLEQLPALPVDRPAAAPIEEETKVNEIEESVLATFDAPPQETEPVQEEPPVEETAAEAVYPAGDPFAQEEQESTRRINLSDLKFGRNYSGDED